MTLLFQSFSFDQQTLDFVSSHYSRLRDFHNGADRSYPFIIIASELANATNLTLVAVNETFQNSPTDHIFPTLVDSLGDLDEEISTPFYAWQFFKSSTFSPPLFVQVEAYALNLAYCGMPQFNTEAFFDFGAFINCFDKWTWMSLIICFAMVTFTLGKFYSNWIDSFFTIFIGLLSPVIGYSAPIIISSNARLSISIVIVSWLLAATVVTNIYLGAISSELIKPAPPDIIQNVNELYDKNFSLVYVNKYGVEVVTAIARDQNITKLLEMVQRAEVHTDSYNAKIAFGEKLAIVAAWPVAASVSITGNELIQDRHKNSSGKVSSKLKQCYVGKNLISPQKLFYALLPPNHEKVERILQRFMDSGINFRWVNEYIGLATAKRVQDRVKLKSPTNILSRLDLEYESSVPTLDMTGKLLKVFFILGIGLKVSCMVFLLEIGVKKLGVILLKYPRKVASTSSIRQPLHFSN